MAKYGEGDARWIVEDRADGRNVNSWHWEEKDLTPKAKERFSYYVNSLAIVDNVDSVTVKVDEVDITAAEATMLNRKGKMRCIFEITAKLKWTGTKKNESGDEVGKTTGAIEVEDFTHDGPNECEIKTTLNDSKADHSSAIYALVKSEGIKKLKAKLAEYVEETIAACRSADESKAQANSSNPTSPAGSLSASPASSPAVLKKSTSDAAVKTNSGVQILKTSFDFSCEPQHIFECFTNSGRFSAITNAPAKLGTKVGDEIELFGGAVTGSVVELVDGSKLVQKWRFSDWPAGHFSKVTLHFKEASSGTCKVELLHELIPSESIERVKDGWNKMIMGRIRSLFGL